MRSGLPLLALVVTSALARQESEPRLLYSRTTDLPAERQAIKNGRSYPNPNVDGRELKQLAALLRPSVTRAFARSELPPCDAASAQQHFSRERPVQAAYKVTGSFTRPGAHQTIWVYTLCSGEGVGYQAGLAVTEEGKLVANFFGNPIAHEAYSVRDVNLNGLSELMLVVPETGRFGSATTVVQLYEFPGGRVRTLGALAVGGPPSPNLVGESAPHLYRGMGDLGPVSVCRLLEEWNAPRTITSREIHVRKGNAPRFFSQAYRLNCGYLESKLHVERVGPSQEVGLTPFKNPFRRRP